MASRPLANTSLLVAAAGTLLLVATGPASAQQLPGSDAVTPDSIVQRLGLPEGHAPRKALRRALMVPGWGQYYNRQYWKVPLAVAGLGGVLYSLIYNWDQYFLYRNAWRYRRGRGTGEFVAPPVGEQEDSYDGEFGGQRYEDAYRTLLGQISGEFGDPLPQAVQERRERFRRWGELSILGVGVFWILQVSDAYVSAHLLGFEIGGEGAREERLSVQVAPVRDGVALRMRF